MHFSVALQIVLGSSAQSQPFAGGQRRKGSAKAVADPALDFDKYQPFLPLGNDIKLPQPRQQVIAAENAVMVRL